MNQQNHQVGSDQKREHVERIATHLMAAVLARSDALGPPTDAYGIAIDAYETAKVAVGYAEKLLKVLDERYPQRLT